ncbi:MAG: Asp-tRNA(Asn)/Glu-tRNA(Gln) amidotransferase subunit GatC [Candidatus Bathyarchaeia archaeon]
MDKLVTKDQVEHIAWLARIELSEEDKELFARQLNEILEYFQKIDQIDTEGIPPTIHVLDIFNIFRSDEVSPSLSVEAALSNASQSKGGYFKAPRIV